MFSNHFLSPFKFLAPWTFCGSKLHNGIICWVKTYFLWAVLSLFLFHRISDWLRPEGALQVICLNHPGQAGPPRACFPGPCPDGFGITPTMESPQPPWKKTCFLIFRGNLLCFCLCSLPLVLALGTTKKVWLQPFYNISMGIFIHWLDPALSAFTYRRSATVPSPPLLLFAGLHPLCPCLSCTYLFLCHS